MCKTQARRSKFGAGGEPWGVCSECWCLRWGLSLKMQTWGPLWNGKMYACEGSQVHDRGKASMAIHCGGFGSK